MNLKRYPDVACLRIPTVEGGLTLFPFRYSELSFYDLPSFLLVPLAAIDLEWGRTRVGSWTNPVRALKSVELVNLFRPFYPLVTSFAKGGCFG
jgi:hypothetical protein